LPGELPRAADIVVVGAGTAGSVVAGRLAERTGRSILLLEAGPDYGPLDANQWPEEFLDHRTFALSHDWNYVNSSKYGKRGMRLERARIVGGSSAHNGCAAVWGLAEDYDAWEREGNPGWGSQALRPLFHEANERLAVNVPAAHEISPFHRAAIDAARSEGFDLLTDFNDLAGHTGVAINPVNAKGKLRWNAAFAYLDPVRAVPTLAIHGGVLVDRVVVEGGRAVAVECSDERGKRPRVDAGEIVLCAGAYGSPAILLRSGVGPADELLRLGIDVVLDLPAVGSNLQDHTGVVLSFEGSPELREALHEFVAAGGISRDEGTTVRARSSLCREAYDLHIYPVGREWSDAFTISPVNMETRSRGSVRLMGRDPGLPPAIDTGFFTDAEGHDLGVVLEGVEIARDLARSGSFARLLGPELGPLAGVTGADLRPLVRAEGVHDYHPSSTCRMGPAGDPTAVVDGEGRVYGIEGLRVADASIIPWLPRANINLPVAVIGERIARGMVG
jgi:choline dehydrogenase